VNQIESFLARFAVGKGANFALIDIDSFQKIGGIDEKRLTCYNDETYE